MSLRPGFTCRAIKTGGKLELTAPQAYKDKASRLPDGEYLVTIEKFVANRSRQQQRYYFGVIVKLFAAWLDEHGHEHAQLLAHETLKIACNPVMLVDPQTGEERIVGGSTQALDVEQFSQFCARCQQYLAEAPFRLYIPDPNEEKEFAA